jgi:hypothetical protein
LGRKISIKERAATNACLEILNTTKNQHIKARVAELLLKSDEREKARVDARQKQHFVLAYDRKLANLESQVASLTNQLEAAKTAIIQLKVQHEEQISSLKAEISAKAQLIETQQKEVARLAEDLSKCSQSLRERMSAVASYIASSDYDPNVLSQYLNDQNATISRRAALSVIVLDKSLGKDQRRKVAVEIIREHNNARQQPPLKPFVDEVKSEWEVSRDEDLEPYYARWYRSPESDKPVLLLKLVAGLAPQTGIETETRARRMLELFYNWTDLKLPPGDREREALFEKAGTLKKRSIEEVEKIVAEREQNEIHKNWSRTDWRNLVKGENNEAQNLIEAAKSGDTGALFKLRQYRQCSNCGHVSHIDRTHQGHCHHCDRMCAAPPGMRWSPVLKFEEVPYCTGGSVACFKLDGPV